MVERDKSKSTLVVATLALCGIVVSLQQTLLIPLLPEFPRLLDTTVEGASWVITATLLTGAASVPTVSRLADMFGKKRMILVVLAVMVFGSAVGAVSSTLSMLVVARALQGVGMALVPVGIAIMRDELPHNRLPLGVGLMSATLAIGGGAGLPLAGLIADRFHWHGVFWVTGAIGALMFVMIYFLLSESPVRSGGTFDYSGAILISLALTAILLAISKGGVWGWGTPKTWLLLVIGGAILAAWVPVELRANSPLVNLHVAAHPGVVLLNIVAVLTGFATFANLLVTTQILQSPSPTGYGQGLDVLHAGLWMVPSALTFGAMAPVSAAITKRLGAQTTLLVGTLIMSSAYVARIPLSTQLWQIVVGSVIVSIGTALAFAAMPMLLMGVVPVTETASANGLNTLLRSVGSSISSAAAATVSAVGVVQVGKDLYPSLSALVLFFWLAAGAAALASILTLPMYRMKEFTAGSSHID